MPTIQDSRILIKSSTVTGTVPTVPASNDHTDGTWLITDLYKGEVFINQADGKVYTRIASGIIQIYPNTSGGSGTLANPLIEQYWKDANNVVWKVTIGTDGIFQSQSI